MAGFFASLTGESDAGQATIDAAAQNRELLGRHRRQGTTIINQGTEQSAGHLNDAAGQWGSLAELGQTGANLYADALGVNGAEGSTRAQGAFMESPGFDFSMDQGLQALERRASAQGRLQSGQTGLDTYDFASDLASREYGSWLDRLGGYNNMYATGTAGGAGASGSLADLYQRAANQKLNLLSDVTQGSMASVNQTAEGQERQTAMQEQGFENLLGTVGQVAGMATGYGGFGGSLSSLGSGSRAGFTGGGLW